MTEVIAYKKGHDEQPKVQNKPCEHTISQLKLPAISQRRQGFCVMHVGLLMRAQRALALAPEGNTSMDAYIHRLSLQVGLTLLFNCIVSLASRLCSLYNDSEL